MMTLKILSWNYISQVKVQLKLASEYGVSIQTIYLWIGKLQEIKVDNEVITTEDVSSSGGTGWIWFDNLVMSTPWMRNASRWWNNLDDGWKIGIGVSVLVGLTALTIATAGAAAAWIGGGIGLATGGVNGFALGTVGGAIAGGLGAPFGFAGNSIIGVGVSSGTQIIQNGSIDTLQLLVAGSFAGLGGFVPDGAIGGIISMNIARGLIIRGVLINIGLVLSEEILNSIFGF